MGCSSCGGRSARSLPEYLATANNGKKERFRTREDAKLFLAANGGGTAKPVAAKAP